REGALRAERRARRGRGARRRGSDRDARPARVRRRARDLRNRRLRRLHRARGRRDGLGLPLPRAARGRTCGHDGRGARRRRPRSACVRGDACVPVRLLHAGDGARCETPPRGEPAAQRGRGPARARRESLPLRLLREDRRGRPAGGREGGAMDELTRFRLDGRVALVAGGSGGIGVRLCAALAGVGARVAVVGRAEGRLAAAREAVERAGGEALVVAGDVTRADAAERAVSETVERWGRLDALVNAVGGGAGAALHDAQDYTEEDWDWIMDLNLRSQFLVSRAAARAMIAGGRGGRILNISSVRGQLGVHLGYSAYVAAKGAMNAL